MKRKILALLLVGVFALAGVFGCSAEETTRNEAFVQAYFTLLSSDPMKVLNNNYYQDPVTITVDNRTLECDRAMQEKLIDYYTDLKIEIVRVDVDETAEDHVMATVVLQDELTKILNLGTYTASVEVLLSEGKIVSITQITDESYLSAYKINYAASIGIDYTIQEDGTLLITKVLGSSPAKDAKLQVNDVIVKIDGVECSSMNKELDEYYYRLRGLAGTGVNLEVKRGEEIITFDIPRQRLTRNE